MLNLFFSFHLLETFCCAKSFSYCKGNHEQCDQIGRFFGLLGNFSKPFATLILPKSPTLLGNFCKGVKILSSEVIFGQLLQAFGDFLLVTLVALISR